MPHQSAIVFSLFQGFTSLKIPFFYSLALSGLHTFAVWTNWWSEAARRLALDNSARNVYQTPTFALYIPAQWTLCVHRASATEEIGAKQVCQGCNATVLTQCKQQLLCLLMVKPPVTDVPINQVSILSISLMFCQRWPQGLHKVGLTVKRKDIGTFLPNCWKTICSMYYTRPEAAFTIMNPTW